VVENRAGAGGDIGTEAVMKAEADGHTLVMGSIALTLKPALFKTLRFDPRTDVTSVARLASQPMIIVARPDFPADNLADFIAMAKASPGRFSFGSPGPGTPQHFGAEMLCAEAGLKMIHVPYKGAVPAMTDIMSGQIDIYYATETSGGAHIAAGRMKPLAVTGDKRLASLPAVKTVAEYGMPKIAVDIWYGLFAPPRMPEAILARLSAELLAMAQGEDYRAALPARARQHHEHPAGHEGPDRAGDSALAGGGKGGGDQAGGVRHFRRSRQLGWSIDAPPKRMRPPRLDSRDSAHLRLHGRLFITNG